MVESIAISSTLDRRKIYNEITPQIEALVSNEDDIVAILANISAVLKEAFSFFWVGFYLVKNEQLVLGPFQGPLACTRIDFDKGVCGHCYTSKKPVIVPNVDEFPGHIACASDSKSEIVLPISRPDGNIFGVLDVDSDKLDDFNEIDQKGLAGIVDIVEKKI